MIGKRNVPGSRLKWAGWFPEKSLSEGIQQSQIQRAHRQKEQQDRQDPPGASHEGEFVCESEGSGGAAPVEKEIRIMNTSGKLPARQIGDPGIDSIGRGRDRDINDTAFGDPAADACYKKSPAPR